jgi:hypothetical protein
VPSGVSEQAKAESGKRKAEPRRQDSSFPRFLEPIQLSAFSFQLCLDSRRRIFHFEAGDRLLKISLIHALVLFAFAGLALAALVSGSPVWGQFLYLLTFATLILAALAWEGDERRWKSRKRKAESGKPKAEPRGRFRGSTFP